MATTKKDFINALWAFANTASELDKIWVDVEGEEFNAPDTMYPFKESFNEVRAQIVEWVGDTVRRIEAIKPPRKPILWKVFKVTDKAGILKESGLTIGEELEALQNDVYLFLSEKKNFQVFQNNIGLFRVDVMNTGTQGTLEECVELIERELGETVE